MQGFSDGQRELLDAESVTGHLLPAGSVFRFLAEHRLVLFPAEMFTDMFPSGRGRPSVATDVVAAVLVLQALNGLSDRQAAEAVTFDLRWKAACGLAVTDTSFHATTLTYWRRRLAASQSPDRIFQAVKDVVAQTGVIKGKTRRVLDSTVLDDAVATQDTVTQLIAAIRRVLRLVPGAEQVLAGRDTACDYSKPGKPDIAWDDRAARATLIDALVRDALTLLDALTSQHVEDPGPGQDGDDGPAADDRAGQALALLALVAGQDVEWIDDGAGGGTWRIARKVAYDRVISTVDTEARHAHKTRSRRQDGFKAHLVVEPDTGIITSAAVTKATGEGTADAAAGQVVLAADDSFTGPGQVLGDSAYGTGPMLNNLDQAGRDAVIKPWPAPPNIPGGFGPDDFIIDHQGATVTCPAGHTTGFTGKRRTATFGNLCAGCPFRDKCTTAKAGRTVAVGEHEQIQRAHRARWATDEQLRLDYRTHRPMVERTIAWVTRGNRKLRYIGVRKNDAWLKLRATGINLRQLCTTGLTRGPGGWEIVTAT